MAKDRLAKLFGHGRGSVGNCDVLGEVAKGGMSVVYRGRRKADNADVAIKIITPEFAQFAEKLEEIFAKGSEGEIAMSLRHHNVVRTFDYGHKGRVYYIVMEFIEGLNLKQLIDQGSPRWSENRLEIAIQVGQGLAFIHKHRLVHRDFCPKNVLLAADGTAKIIDFGLAIPAQLKQKWRWDRSGTAAYMSPEQVRGQKVDQRTDVYAYGVSMYEMLTGHRPYPDDRDRFRKMAVHLNVEPTSPRKYNRNIPVALEHILFRAMAKSVGDRYASVEQMLKEVQAVTATFFGDEPRLPVE